MHRMLRLMSEKGSIGNLGLIVAASPGVPARGLNDRAITVYQENIQTPLRGRN
jgi:hypothetical protein